jgi:hypothetical protein
MFNLRATAKLLRRLKCAPAEAGDTTTRLGDWYGNLFSVGRQQFAMFTSERSLLSVVLPAKEIRPLPTALINGLRWLLDDLRVPRALIDDELARMDPCVIAATSSRSAVTSMNDFVIRAKQQLGKSPPVSLAELHRRLAEMPMKPLGYRFPCEVALDLLSTTKSPA